MFVMNKSTLLKSSGLHSAESLQRDEGAEDHGKAERRSLYRKVQLT